MKLFTALCILFATNLSFGASDYDVKIAELKDTQDQIEAFFNQNSQRAQQFHLPWIFSEFNLEYTFDSNLSPYKGAHQYYFHEMKRICTTNYILETTTLCRLIQKALDRKIKLSNISKSLMDSESTSVRLLNKYQSQHALCIKNNSTEAIEVKINLLKAQHISGFSNETVLETLKDCSSQEELDTLMGLTQKAKTQLEALFNILNRPSTRVSNKTQLERVIIWASFFRVTIYKLELQNSAVLGTTDAEPLRSKLTGLFGFAKNLHVTINGKSSEDIDIFLKEITSKVNDLRIIDLKK